MKNQAAIGTIAGTIAGLIYFYMEESGVPKDSNAQYLAPVSTDILAWGFGAALVYKGYKYKDGALAFIGSSVMSIHLAQFAAHKIINKRK